MRKGFGFYAPHEATSLFLKVALVSLWIGVDIVAVLYASTVPHEDFTHSLLMPVAFLVLVSGTVFSVLIAWATGSLFGKKAIAAGSSRIAVTLYDLKRDPRRLLGVGAAAVVAIVSIAGYVFYWDGGDNHAEPASCINPVLAEKCSEVARLEGKLFRSDEHKILSKCLIQYDRR